MSVAHKYALIQIFAIPTVDEKDPELHTQELAPKTTSKPVESKRTDPKRVEIGLQVKEILEDKCFTDSDIAELRKDFATCDDKDLDGFLATVKHLKSVKSIIPSEIVK
jgi:hypothetical protein